MWIMLTKKLPTQISPPKLSIFWSTPWPMNIEKRWHQTPSTLWFDKEFATREPDYEGARKIHYKDTDIRVFPHEFSEIIAEKLMYFIDGGSHELIPGSVADDELIDNRLTKGKRPIYDAALVDGCTKSQAMLVAFGKDPTIEIPEVPAVGWYKCRKEYAQYFCYEKEMKE